MPADETLARQRYQTDAFEYTWSGRWPSTAAALVILVLATGWLVTWIRWSTCRILYGNHEAYASAAKKSRQFERLWKDCTLDERHVLLQITRERIANPYQQPLVTELLRRGLLRLDPDLRPFSEAFEQFLLQQESAHRSALHEWEQVEGGHSWRYMRIVLVASVIGIALFLMATQPGLQSSLLGVATALTALVAAAGKLREAVAAWLPSRKATA